MKQAVCALWIFFLVLLVFFSAPLNARADLFPLPPLDDDDTAFLYQAQPLKKDGVINKKWGIQTNDTFYLEEHKQIKDNKGEKIIMTLEFTDKNFGTTILTLTFKKNGDFLRQDRFIKEVIDFTGERAFFYDIDFSQVKTSFPHDSYVMEIMTFLFRGLDFQPKSKFFYYWWISEKAVVPRYAMIKEPKEITIPSGTYQCYPVELFVNVIDFVNKGKVFNRILNPFMPENMLYFNVEPPHYFVHYRGPLGSPGSGEVKLDFVKIIRGRDSINRARQKLRNRDNYNSMDNLLRSFIQ